MAATDRQRKWIKRSAWGVGGLTVLLGVAMLVMVFYLRSEAGNRFFADQLEDLLSDPETETRVIVENLRGDPLDEFSVGTLRVTERGETLVLAKGINARWNPWALVGSVVHFEEFTVDELDLFQISEVAEEADEASDLIPSIPVDLTLDSVVVNRLCFDGNSTAFSLEALLNWRRLDVIDLDFVLAPINGGGERADLRVAYAPAKEHLMVEGVFTAKADGPLGGFVLPGADDDVSITLSGSGPLMNWQGNMDGAMGGKQIADLELHFTQKDQDVLTLDGQLTPGFLRDDPLLDGLAGDLSLDVDVIFRRGLPQEYRASIEAAVASLTLEGGLETTKDLLASRFVVRSRDTSRFDPFLDGWTINQFRVEGGLPESGALNETRLTVAVIGVKGPGVFIPSLGGQVTLRNVREDSRQFSGLGLGALRVETDVTLDARWSIDALFDPDSNRLDLKALGLKNESIQMTTAGSVVLDPLDVSLTAALTARDLADWQDLFGLNVSGSASADAALTLDARGLQSVSLDLTTREFVVDDPALAQILGSRPSLKANAGPSPEGTAIKAQLQSQSLAARVTGVLIEDQSGIDAEYAIEIPDPSKIGLLSDFIAPLLLEGRVMGALDDPALTARTSIASIPLGNALINQVNVEVDAVAIVSAPNGSVTFNASLDGDDVAGGAHFSVGNEGRWQVDDIELKGKPLTFTGSMAAPVGQPAEGSFSLSVNDRTLIGRVLGQTLQSSATGNLDLVAIEGEQGIGFALEMTDLSGRFDAFDRVSIGSVTAKGKLIAADGIALQDLVLEGQDVRAEDALLKTFGLNVDAKDTGLGFRVTAEGRFQGPLSLEIAGLIDDARLAVPNAVTLELVSGTLAGQVLALGAPATLSLLDDNSFTLTPFELQYGGGRLAMSAEIIDGIQHAVLSTNGLDLGLLAVLADEQNISGLMDLQADVELTAAPEASLTISVDNLLIGDELRQQPIDLKFESTLSQGVFDGLISLKTADRLSLTADARLPIVLDPEDFVIEILLDQPAAGSIEGQAALGDIWPLLGAYDHRLAGDAELNAVMSGTLNNPRLAGTFDIRQVDYRNLSTGARIQAPRIGLKLKDGLLELAPVDATDGGSGVITLSGWVKPFAEGGAEANFTVAMKKAKLLQLRDAKAAVSGEVSYVLDGKGAKAKADVTIDDAEIGLVSNLPPEVVTLDVVEINRPAGLIALPEKQPQDGPPTVLNVRVGAKNQFFVRGRGLESEWQGDLSISGTIEVPKIAGGLNLVRGDFQFAGKRFDLTEGKIDFTGGKDIDPIITARAVYDVDSLTAQINLNGPLSKPNISLTSRPELPEDEILSRIMFGTGKERLSAIQAAQLGVAVASMSGGGGGFDVVGKIRKALSLERLEIGTTEGENGTSPLIRGGKYLTDNIYVEVGTARGEDDATSASIDVDLTKHITVGTEATSTGNQKLRLRWKWDY